MLVTTFHITPRGSQGRPSLFGFVVLLRHGLQNAWHVFLPVVFLSFALLRQSLELPCGMAMLHLGDVGCLIFFH
jgi:hypothetical protein